MYAIRSYYAINAVNDAPLAVADAYNAEQNVTLVVSAAAGVMLNDSDVDSDRNNFV